MAASPAELAARVSGLTKVYGGGVRALDGVDLAVARGQIFGLLGPNGAGKTTLVKILLGIARRTGGSAELLGKPAPDAAVRRRVGYLPEGHRFPGYLTGRQALDYLGALSHVPRGERRERTGRLLERVGLAEAADRKVRGYSKGMSQRLGLAQALIAEPELLLLDEPTDGVDPVGRREIRDLLEKLRGEGKTVIISSHILTEIELICDRIAVLNKGALIHEGPVEDLTRSEGEWEFEVAGGGEAIGAAMAEHALFVRPLGEGHWLVRVEKEAQLDAIVDAIRRKGAGLRGLAPRRATLEDKVVAMLEDPAEMMAIYAVARDSFREATDRAISRILLLLSLIVGAGVLGFGYPEVAVEKLVSNAMRESGAHRLGVGVERAPAADGRAVDLFVKPRRAPGEPGDDDDGLEASGPPAERLSEAAEKTRYMLEKRGVRSVKVSAPGEVAPGGPGQPRLRMTLDYDPLDVRGGNQLKVVMWQLEVLDHEFTDRRRGREVGLGVFIGQPARQFIVSLESFIAGALAGLVGMIIAVIATSGFVPSMLAGGTAHLLLAKPVRRSTLLLGKYVGGVAFVFFHASVVTAFCILAIWARTGWFDARFLVMPVAAAGLFAILYSVSVLAGVIFETPVVSVLLSIGFWLFCKFAREAKFISTTLSFAKSQGAGGPGAADFRVPERVQTVLDAVYAILPKPTDVGNSLDKFISEGRMGAEMAKVHAELFAPIDPLFVVWSSAAFVAVVLAGACFVFSRRDY